MSASRASDIANKSKQLTWITGTLVSGVTT